MFLINTLSLQAPHAVNEHDIPESVDEDTKCDASNNLKQESKYNLNSNPLEVWNEILNEENSMNDRNFLIDIAYLHAIPNTLRSKLWFILSGAQDLMRKNQNVYKHLTECIPNNKCSKQINKDLNRTFGSKEMNNKYCDKLRRILVAYSNYNQSLPYTQGMNYIAAFILKQYFEITPNNNHYIDDCIEEEQSFWVFTAIMSKIGALFNDDLIGFHKAVQCFIKILSDHGPKDLVNYLNKLGERVYFLIFTTWYHTLFTHCGWNDNMIKRVWDMFILQQMDFSFILKLSYFIFIHHEQELMKKEFIDIITFFKSKDCLVFHGLDHHDMISRASKLKLNELYLEPMRNLKYLEMDDDDDDDDDNNDNEQDTKSNKLWPYLQVNVNFDSKLSGISITFMIE